MKNKYLSVAALLLSAFYFTTCGNNTGGAETWSWTERSFSLEVSGSGETIQVGDSFTLDYTGFGTLAGTVREVNPAENSRAIGDNTNPGMGRIIIDPYPLDDNEDDNIVIHIPPVPPGPPAPPPAVYIDSPETEIAFSGNSKPVKGVINRDGLIANIVLPESVGTDETAASYTQGRIKEWTFNKAAGTYSVQFDWPPGYELGVEGLVDYETGSYSWNAETKTLFLLPQKQAEDYYHGVMRTKEETAAFLPTVIREDEIPGMTNNKYKTMNEFVAAWVNQAYGLQVYTYETSGGSFTKFTRNFATTLDHDEVNKTIGGLKYTGTPVTSDNFGTIHYRLETTNFADAEAKLTNQLGAPSDEKPLKDSSTLTVGTDWIILEDCAIYDTYRLAYYSPNEYLGEGFQWPRTNIGGGD